MPEFREHYFLPRKVVIAGKRTKRPKDLKEPKPVEKSSDCPFCPGNEAMTPPETERIEEQEKWIMRVFPNKFPTVSLHSKARGFHEVVVETRAHGERFHEFGTAKIASILSLLSKRCISLEKKIGISFVAVFKNSGNGSGASLHHEHSQLVALSFVPKPAKEEYSAFESYKLKNKKCPLCSALEQEKQKKERIVFEGDKFIALAPYASRFCYELMIVPKEHKNSFTEFSEEEFLELGKILKKSTKTMSKIRAPYNILFHNRKKGEFHCYVELLPRLATWAGFEFMTGVSVNSVLPEEAAEVYRENWRK